MKKSLTMSAIGVAAALASANASADGLKQLLDVLQENGTISNTEYQQLLAEAKGSDFKIEQKDGLIKLKSADGKFEFKVRGRLQFDGGLSFSDSAGVAGGQSRARAFDYADFRRARLGAEGTVFGDWKYVFEVDFAGNGVSVADAFITYGGLKKVLGFPLDIKLGHHKEGTGLEELTSSRFITFLERSTSTLAFAPSRNLGVTVSTHGNEKAGWSYVVGGGVFAEGFDRPALDPPRTASGASAAPIPGRDETIGYGARGVIQPFIGHSQDGKRITKLVHVGGSVNQRDGRATDSITSDFYGRYRARPFADGILGGDRDRIIDTGGIAGVEDRTIVGGEVAVIYNNFSVQGEYFNTELSRPNSDLGDVELNGYYVLASWFPTGESRGYKASSATFDRVKVLAPLGKGGYGAWELAARWDETNLNDVAAGVQGGRVEGYTVGVNWYPVSNLRFTANYFDQVRDDATGPTINGVSNQGIGVRGLAFRAQVDW